MTVILDAMGGDHAPAAIVRGAIEAAREFGHEIVLVGSIPEMDASLGSPVSAAIKGLPISLEHTDEWIKMDCLHPASELRKLKGASIRVAARLVRKTPKSALVSAGHTGAVMTAALMDIGRIKGIDRPGIAAIIPTMIGSVVVIDVGANVDCKPKHLLRFAQMGRAYATYILKIPDPQVGLLNIGSEASKGNDLSRATHEILAASDLPFIGNVEPDKLYEGLCHVVATDGFVGNIFLKTSEGVANTIKGMMKRAAGPLLSKSLAALKPLLGSLSDFNPDHPDHAGAPLLGIDGACLIVHGSARAETVKSAIDLGERYATSETLSAIRKAVSEESAA